MPMQEASLWDFFNPFDSYNQELPHYTQKGFALDGSFSISPNSSEVRESEGIPELEEETKHESSMRESLKARKAVENTTSNRIDNVDISAKVKVSCGDDVAKILEVRSIRYRPRSRILKLIVSRMMGTFALLFSEPPVNNAEQSTIGSSSRTHNSIKRIDSTTGVEINTMSSEMDRLYVCEKRLHKEIMVCSFRDM
ncbi:hypothetical protein ZWY2020_030237 [Hordeum vulgare]|nr:hypothetical protein ZWY2020_030237 [Hordeum vulgare]